MDGQTFNSADKVVTAFNRFDLEAANEADVLAALKYATMLPFRSGASKQIVLLPCDSCQEKTLRYSDLQRALLNNDITLHVLSPEQIMLKSRSPKSSYIFGVDEDTVFTSRDVSGSEIEGDASLRRYIRLPKDLCVALAQDTEGSIFSAKQWLESSYMMQKKFTDVFVRTIADKAEPTECQICECVAETGHLSGRSQCHSCEPRTPLYTLMPNFFSPDFNDNDLSGRYSSNNEVASGASGRRSRQRDRTGRRRSRMRDRGVIPSRPEIRDQ